MKHLFKVTYQLETEEGNYIAFVQCVHQGDAAEIGKPKFPSGEPKRVSDIIIEPLVAMSSIIDG